MAGSCNGRKCLRSEVVGDAYWVSKVGPSTPRPPSSETSTRGNHPVPDGGTSVWNGATVTVVLTAVVALIGMIVIVIILRRKRIREEQTRNNIAQSGNLAKGRPGEEDVIKEGKWSTGQVELVVMAGENQPTYLAHLRLHQQTTLFSALLSSPLKTNLSDILTQSSFS